LSRIQQKIARQNEINVSAIPQRQAVSSIRLVYIVAIGFAVISAFATGYFIGQNNFKYMNSANQINQKQTEQSQANSTTDHQYENSFSIY
jgi:phosphotransferase system  glucose/maltose/N-acetylglucosamine-specific IIC component